MSMIKPAEIVIQLFGGVRATARAIGRDATSVCKWRQSRERGGTGGYIPMPIQRKILLIASKRNLKLTPSDLIWGRPKQNGK